MLSRLIRYLTVVSFGVVPLLVADRLTVAELLSTLCIHLQTYHYVYRDVNSLVRYFILHIIYHSQFHMVRDQTDSVHQSWMVWR